MLNIGDHWHNWVNDELIFYVPRSSGNFFILELKLAKHLYILKANFKRSVHAISEGHFFEIRTSTF